MLELFKVCVLCHVFSSLLLLPLYIRTGRLVLELTKDIKYIVDFLVHCQALPLFFCLLLSLIKIVVTNTYEEVIAILCIASSLYLQYILMKCYIKELRNKHD